MKRLNTKQKAKKLNSEIQKLFRKHGVKKKMRICKICRKPLRREYHLKNGMYIDVYSDYNAWLRHKKTDYRICEVVGDCEIYYKEICSYCNEKPAEQYCKECEEIFCDDCYESHKEVVDYTSENFN